MKKIILFSVVLIFLVFSNSFAETKILDVNDIIRYVNTDMVQCKHSSWKGFLAVDRYYRVTTVSEIIKFMKPALRATKRLSWSGEAGDCDDASVIFKAELIKVAARIGDNPFPIGIVSMTNSDRNDLHSMIWFVDDEMQMWLIEPRTGDMTHYKLFNDLKLFWMMG